jgi:hypothetical protein
MAKLCDLSRAYIEARYPSGPGLLPSGKPTITESRKFYEFAKCVYTKTEKFLEKLKNG